MVPQGKVTIIQNQLSFVVKSLVTFGGKAPSSQKDVLKRHGQLSSNPTHKLYMVDLEYEETQGPACVSCKVGQSTISYFQVCNGRCGSS